jgi:dipeptidyl aminopeptidase/acylaminoacyl peptidase
MKTILLFLLALASSAVAAPRPMTVEDVATMPWLSQPRLSPDGRRVAFVVGEADLARSRYQTDIWLVGADGSRPFPLAHSRANDRSPQWAHDGRLTFLSDRGGSSQIWIIDPDGGEAVPLSQHPSSVGDFRWSPDGRSIAFTARDPEPEALAARRREGDDARVLGSARRHEHLWVLDPGTRKATKITDGDFTVFEFDWSPDGRKFVIAKSTGTGLTDKFRSDLYLIDARGGELAPLVVQPGTDTNPRFSPDGRWIAFVTGQGKADWAADDDLAVVPATGGTPRVISADYDRHVQHVTWAPDSRTIYFNGPWNLREQLFRVGIDGSGFSDISKVAGVATGAHFLPSRDAVVFVSESLTEPPEVFISPLSRFTPRRLTDINARTRELQLGERRVVRWKNPEDGLEIEGILTLPLGFRAGTRVPLLTFVHGGPSSQFSDEFLGYLAHAYPPHVFAARGYAVLQPNPRGSGAYGEPFRMANRADWGGADFRDVMAGIDSLIEQGIADPERLGIMGWSYGGFLSAWAITQTDRFRAASIGAPVVDLLSMEGTSDIPGFITSFFDTVPWSAGDLIRAHNPISHVANAKTPALIQHGEEDARVPLAQGRMLYQALLDLGVPVTMVVYPRTPHTAREPRLRMDVMKRNLWWFDRWIKGDERPYGEWTP